MEHSVCKVSLAHHTKEWLSALFEALDGLELGVNNYLFSYFGLPVATNAFPVTSTSFLLQSPSTFQLTKEQGMVLQSEPTCLHIVSWLSDTGLCLVNILDFCLFKLLTCQVIVPLVTGRCVGQDKKS